MLKLLLLLIGATAAAGFPDAGIPKAVDITSTAVSFTWESSTISQSTSTDLTSSSISQSNSTDLTFSQAVPTGTTARLSASANPTASQYVPTHPTSTQTTPVEVDPGRLWVLYRRTFMSGDPGWTYLCYYDIFESHVSVKYFNPCHPYNATLHLGTGSECDAGYQMPIPQFDIGFNPFGVNTNCSYHPDVNQVVCDQGHYPCAVFSHDNWVHCIEDTDSPNYNAYFRIQCDYFPVMT
ncbi:Putative protein of unknown function [Podospora comata]|uniref:Uncharacterized protein n=1 Tax=Podospora comata TaxID=48703 RepID=A0ABY6SJE6_PODCO|nr:Putative protein of unknown function [Podospora comata]